MNTKDLQGLMDSMGYVFNDKNIIIQALTHSSFAYENKNTISNERLEFLGDAVVELCISDIIFRNNTNMSEGDLTKSRSNLVCEASLAAIARKIKIGEFLRLGRGEETSGGRNREAVLADALEAVIGAVYLDGGFEKVYAVLTNLFSDSIQNSNYNSTFRDHKTFLQEIIQRNSKEPINYYIINERGPDHDKIFTAQVIHNNVILGIGSGKNKKEAEQNAAYQAINKLNLD